MRAAARPGSLVVAVVLLLGWGLAAPARAHPPSPMGLAAPAGAYSPSPTGLAARVGSYSPSPIGLAAPVGASPPVPASPTGLSATNGSASISLSWTQPTTSPRPTSFRVYEGTTVVARNTTTRVTVPDLAFGSTHTYQVVAVDGAGRESAPSLPVTRRVLIGGAHACGITVPTGLTATEVTASAVSLSWSNVVPTYDQQGTIVVLRNGERILQTTVDSARIGGLAPASTHTFQVARLDCQGTLHTSPPLTVTTAPGAAARAAAPGTPTVGARTASSVALSWTGRTGTGPAVRYAVYAGATRVATTSSTSALLGGLWRDTAYEYTVAAVDAAGNESAHSAPVQTSTLPCPDAPPTPGAPDVPPIPGAPDVPPIPGAPDVPPTAGAPNAPTELAATAISPSSVALSWVQVFEATSFTVYRVASAALPLGPVATTRTTSAMVTGLPSDSTASYAMVAQTAGCGPSPLSAPVRVTTPAGPGARPGPPADLRVLSRTPNPDFTGTVALAWTQPPGDDPPVSFRLYEGAALFAASDATAVTLRLPGGPAHSVTVAAVDAAGNESAQSPPVVFTVPFIPPP